MEGQQYPTQEHHQYEEDTQAGLHSGEGDQGEKKSVLTKVKDKAKKIKNTIKKHSPGGHDHDNDNLEEEDDNEEDMEMVDAPELHGAPVISCTDLPRQVDVDLEKPTDRREDRYDPNPRGPSVRDEGISRPSLGKTEPELVKPPIVQPHTPEKRNVEEPRDQIRPLKGLGDDPHSPKNNLTGIPPTNYQSKVADPTGGKEADVEPLVHRLDNLHVHDESKPKPGPEHSSYTRSHEQFAPQETPIQNQFNPEANPDIIHDVDPKTIPRDTVAGKLSSATSAVAQRAVSAKNTVVSKLGYGGGQQIEESKLPASTTTKPVTETAMEYAHTMGEKLAPIYGKVAGAGSTVISKVKGTGGTKQGEDNVARETGTDKGVSVKEYLAEKFKPGEEDKALSEAITEALHKKKVGVRKTREGEPVMGKVTESDEVAERLGTGMKNKREGEDAVVAGKESSGQGMVDRFKDAVGSWLGKSNGIETAKQSVGESYVSDSVAGSAPAKGEGDPGQQKTCA